jgi:hypothetical protein
MNVKNDSEIIKTADPLYGPGDEVMHKGYRLRVRDFSWSALKQTWTYCLVVGADRRSMGSDEIIPHFESAPEFEITGYVRK